MSPLSRGTLAGPAIGAVILPVRPGQCWGPGGGAGVRYGQGGVFHALVRPQEAITLRAIRDEAKLRRHGISRYNKRWRSWAQNRVRQYQLPLPVTLTSDTNLMDATYMTSCVQKAAALRKHDLQLWRGYSARILELKGDFLPEQIGYILWGYGKTSFMDAKFYNGFLPVVKEQLPQFQSHGVMSLMWLLKRLKWNDRDLVQAAAQHTLNSVDTIRPIDFIKISSAMADLGLKEPGLRSAMSRIAVQKMEELTAQQFRDAVNPLTIGNLWTDDVIVYVMERFRRIFITARPLHLMKAYESAVVCRVQHPQVWRALSHEAKQFYVRLSQRHIHDAGREPTAMHWEVSRHLVDIGEAHRNSFRWGPLYIDIGLDELEEDERRRCIMVDTPNAFFAGSDQYLPRRRLQHRLLTNLGWDVRRVRWDDWAALGLDVEKKRDFLRKLLAGARPLGEELADRSPATPAVVHQRLWTYRENQAAAEAAEKAALDEQKIDFDI